MSIDQKPTVLNPKSLQSGDVIVKTTKQRRNKCDLGPDFVAPDGGWGWLICIAAGLSNLCSFALLQQFGLLFRDRLHALGMINTEITTIINLQACVTSFVGLLNGPIFRIFTYRQVAFWSAICFSIGIFLTSFSYSFTTYVITFSVLYGIGSGFNASSNSLALNTYFKNKRRIATGCTWTLTAFGPILLPQIIAILLPYYGVQGTVWIFSAFALNAAVLALLYHPVQWHTKPLNEKSMATADAAAAAVDAAPIEVAMENKCTYCQRQIAAAARRKQSIFSSQYLYNSDNHSIAGYEIIDPGTPMMSRANDGWYSTTAGGRRSASGSKWSLNSTKPNSRIQSSHNLELADRPSCVSLTGLADKDNKDNNRKGTEIIIKAKEERREKRRKEFSERIKIDEAPSEDCDSHKAPQDINATRVDPKFTIYQDQPNNVVMVQKSYKDHSSNGDEQMTLLESGRAMSGDLTSPKRKISTNSFQSERELLNGVSQKLEQFQNGHERQQIHCTCTMNRPLNDYKMDSNDIGEMNENYTIYQKILIFFDLDLLKDFTYVNLMIGVTIAGFAELNYSILTPFVLSEYGFSKREIASVLSILGIMDISVRFVVPIIAGRIGWQNKTFFMVGIMGMAIGRIFIAHFHSYYAVLAASCWIGLNKGLRTVFMALVIPTYVPLDRLPGASGLQLVFAGIFYFLFGPLLGWIRDTTNYTITLHCLNILSYLTCICWSAESYYHYRMAKKKINEIY